MQPVVLPPYRLDHTLESHELYLFVMVQGIPDEEKPTVNYNTNHKFVF